MHSLKKYLLNRSGYFGGYGGRYIPELIIPVMEELEAEFYSAVKEKKFRSELRELYNHFSGRPTPLIFCENISKKLGGARVFLKNEGGNHTGAHKINHCLGQGVLAKRLKKKRLIAETGAGQHGLATATVAAKLKMDCTIYMGEKDYIRQRPNVFFMEQLGAEVIPVRTGGRILRDAITAALRDIITYPQETHYLLGTVCGPHPYPVMNTYFQSIVGTEVRKQLLEQTGKLPDMLIASVGGGSNALGLFWEFLDDPNVRMRVVEAGGKGLKKNQHGYTHAARFVAGNIGIVEGFKSYFLQDVHGQIESTQSISAGLDYSGVGPQLSYLKDIGRIETSYALDREVLRAYQLLAREEGLIPALESAHAFAEVLKIAPRLSKQKTLVWNCSGRGEKDLFITAKQFDRDNFSAFLQQYLSAL